MAVKEKITYKTFKDEEVERFLNGKNTNKKHIVCIEGSSYTNTVQLVCRGYSYVKVEFI